jgi:heavy metal translocating P-type ATPase
VKSKKLIETLAGPTRTGVVNPVEPLTPQKLWDIKEQAFTTLSTLSASTDVNAVWHSLRDMLKQVDDQYQQWVEARIEPLLSGKRLRHADMLDGINESDAIMLPDDKAVGMKLAGADAVSIGEQKKEINRNFALSFAVTAVALGAQALALPAAPICLPLYLYISRYVFYAAYEELSTKRKVGGTTVISILNLGICLGGFYVPGGLASALYFASEKVILITQDGARRKLINIMGQLPSRVWLLTNGQETEVPLKQVQAGDTIIVGAGQVIPVDGLVVTGNAMVDQHRLTGESQPVEKAVDDPVLATTMVMAGKLYIQVSQTGSATTAAQIGEILNNSANSQLSVESKAIELADSIAVPTLLVAALAWPLVSYQGAVAITGAGIGGNLRVTAPISMLNYLNLAAEQGILIKDGRSLEMLAEIDTVIFDKTGTLTEDQPHVASIHCMEGFNEDHLLACVAAIEARQSHPIARAIVAAAQERGLSLPAIDDAHYTIGYGIKAQIEGNLFRIGSNRFMEAERIEVPPEVEQLQKAAYNLGHSLVLVAVDDRLAGVIELEATIRPEVAEIVAHLHKRKMQVYIISGDQEDPTRQLAQSLGIEHYFANTLPSDKAKHVERLQKEGHKVCFVGDGINDALALRHANVSISLSGATSAATDTAQIVMMDQSLRQLPTLLNLANEFNANMQVGYAAAFIPGIATIGGVFLLKLGIFASAMIYNIGLFAGVGVALLPLLLREKEYLELVEKTDM